MDSRKPMNGEDLQALWSDTLRMSKPTVAALDQLADTIVEVHNGGDPDFREHINNRFNRVTESTGQTLDAERFDVDMARAFIADEIGFGSWADLIAFTEGRSDCDYPLLFKYAIAALWRGDFTSLENAVGGPDAFDKQINAWLKAGYIERESETMAECFAAACMLGHDGAAAALLDAGVDPYAGMRTGLAGFHYAASSGRLNVIKLLIDREVPMEVKNMYGGTVFGQAIWSAVNEYAPDHSEIVERLVEAGAIVDEGYEAWWEEQEVPDGTTKARIANVLKNYAEFRTRRAAAEKQVEDAENGGSDRALADALKSLGNILRRPRFSRGAANAAYTRSAALYAELGLPLEESWVKRHIGINYEYAERLGDAEHYYDEALALFREHAGDGDRNYANTVRYPAVIKNRLGKREESAALWEEAVRRYADMNEPFGVAEGAGWLTIFAIERADLEAAREWFAQADAAARSANDRDTYTFVNEVETKLRQAEASWESMAGTSEIKSFASGEDWRKWLDENHSTSPGILLRIFKKDSGKKTATYAEALDEALCYGWIDGIRKSFDEISYLQKFTPRQKRSIWSKRNQEHVDRLIKEGRMEAAGLAEIDRAKKDGRWERAYDSPKNMEVPYDFLKELKKDKKAFEHFETLTKVNKFAIAFRLHNAKRPETRERRMRDFLERLARGEKIV